MVLVIVLVLGEGRWIGYPDRAARSTVGRAAPVRDVANRLHSLAHGGMTEWPKVLAC